MMTDENSDRFRMYGRDSIIEFHGAISDATDFSQLREFVKEDNVINLGGVTTASWLGMLSMDRSLRDFNKKFKLINIPGNVYRYFRILPDVTSYYEIDSLRLPKFDGSNFMTSDGDFHVTAMELGGRIKGSKTSLLPLESNTYVDGFGTRWSPALFDLAKMNPQFANPWFKDNSGEGYFWLNLLEYWETTIGLSMDLVTSQRIGLYGILRRLTAMVKAAETGFSAVGKVSDRISVRLAEITAWLMDECRKLEGQITEALRKCEKHRRKAQMMADQSTNDATRQELYGCLRDAAIAIEWVSIFLNNIEPISFQAGEKILGLGIVRTFKGVLLKIDALNLKQETVDKIREGFSILDPFSSGTWAVTKQDILNELAVMEKDLGHCVVLFQGFDLLRQVLEHRVAEATILKSHLLGLANDTNSWLEVQEKIFGQIIKTLVTDQEKYAFAFFLPEGYESYKNSEIKAPGDILLF